MNIPNREKIVQWASDWADAYEQDWTEEKLREWMGKVVLIQSPPRTEEEEDEQPEGHKATVHVVGFSVDTLVVPTVEGEDDEAIPDVHRFSFLTSDGLQIPLFAKSSLTHVEGPEE